MLKLHNTNNNYIILIFLTLFLFNSCKNGDNKFASEIKDIKDLLNAFPVEININAEVFINDTINLMDPEDILIIGDYLIVKNRPQTTEFHISVFEMKTGKYAGNFLKIGRGPNEYLGINLSYYGKDTLMVLDIQREEALLFSEEKINTCNSIPDGKIKFETKKDGDMINRCYKFNNIIVCSGQFYDGRFNIFSTEGKYLGYFDNYPNVTSNVPYDNYHLGYIFGFQDFFSNNTDQSKLVNLNQHSLSIFKKSNNSFDKLFNTQWSSPIILDARYQEGRPLVLRDGSVVIGAGKIAATENYVFFNFSEYTVSEIAKQGYENIFGYILVANWSGKPIAKLNLNENIKLSLDVDDEQKYLYSFQTNMQTGFSQIVRYDLDIQKQF